MKSPVTFNIPLEVALRVQRLGRYYGTYSMII